MAVPSRFSRRVVQDGKEVVGFYPHLGQARVLRSKARFVLVVAGIQSGKTILEPLWTQQEIASWWAREGPCQEEGEADHLVVSATYDLLEAKVIPAYKRLFCEQTRWGEYKAARNVIQARVDKSRIVFRSAEDPESLASFTARSAVCDEFGQERVSAAAWEEVRARLTTTRGRALIATTIYAINWFVEVLYQRAKGKEKDYELISFPSNENPHFEQEELDDLRLSLPDWKFRMRYLAELTRPAGMIYSDYRDIYAPQVIVDSKPGSVDIDAWLPDTHGHLVRPFRIPDNWLRQVGVDFGGTEHTALLWFAEPPGQKRYYAYREALGGGLTGREHARLALEYREPVSLWIGGTRGETSGTRSYDARLAWGQEGVPVIEPFIHEVEAGLDQVISLLKQNRLFIFDTLTGLRGELNTYSRELDAAGEPTMKIADKESKHFADALRYVASAWQENLPGRPEPDALPLTQAQARAAAMDGLDKRDEPLTLLTPLQATDEAAHRDRLAASAQRLRRMLGG